MPNLSSWSWNKNRAAGRNEHVPSIAVPGANPRIESDSLHLGRSGNWHLLPFLADLRFQKLLFPCLQRCESV